MLPRVYMAEVMPMQIRGKGSALATCVGNWMVGTLWNQISPIALGSIKWKYYLVFIMWSECAFAFIETLLTPCRYMCLPSCRLLFVQGNHTEVPGGDWPTFRRTGP